jgi:hypothetical protein
MSPLLPLALEDGFELLQAAFEFSDLAFRPTPMALTA